MVKHCRLGHASKHTSLDYLLEDSAADGHIAGEGALLVNVLTLDGGLRGLEAYKKAKATNAPQLAPSQVESNLRPDQFQTRLW